MYIIYEEIFRYIGGSTSSNPIGYVETKEEAQEICDKLDNNMREKNEINTFGWKSYSFEAIKHLTIDDIK